MTLHEKFSMDSSPLPHPIFRKCLQVSCHARGWARFCKCLRVNFVASSGEFSESTLPNVPLRNTCCFIVVSEIWTHSCICCRNYAMRRRRKHFWKDTRRRWPPRLEWVSRPRRMSLLSFRPRGRWWRRRNSRRFVHGLAIGTSLIFYEWEIVVEFIRCKTAVIADLPVFR